VLKGNAGPAQRRLDESGLAAFGAVLQETSDRPVAHRGFSRQANDPIDFIDSEHLKLHLCKKSHDIFKSARGGCFDNAAI
jgi:hypothetical protein